MNLYGVATTVLDMTLSLFVYSIVNISSYVV
jgi:hypothetical protein